jgi:polysaccharide deacetylase 2 family uncharacterized protein YibQ
MLDRRRSTLLDRLGRRLVKLSAAARLTAGLTGLLFFLLFTSYGVSNGGAWLAAHISRATVATAVSEPGDAAAASRFLERLERVTDIAMRCFLETGLSKQHIITNYTEQRTAGHLKFPYRYWEVWAPADFDFNDMLRRFREQLAHKLQNAVIDEVQVDAKTYRVAVSVDGLDTHRFFFTKAAQEAPEGAKLLLSYLPAGQQKIDVDAIPQVQYIGAPRIAIIIDDIGYRDAIDRLFFQLPAKVTFSVLPFSPSGREFANTAHDRGHEIMLHLPMEPISYPAQDPGRGKLLLAMSDEAIRRQVETDMDQVPNIVGVNNHMGSAFTADASKMRVALEPIKSRGLFFVDSMTIGRSVAFGVARAEGLRTAARNLFLDINPDYDAICRQVELLGRVARAQGSAIAIGHPFQNTYRALLARLPELIKLGIEIVPVSSLVR